MRNQTFHEKRTIFASETLLAMLVEHLQSVVNTNCELWSNMNDWNSNSVNFFQDCNCIWLIQSNTYTHGILYNSINNNNIYAKEFALQRIDQNNKWKKYSISGEFNLLAIQINGKYIIIYLSICTHGFNTKLFILLNTFLEYISVIVYILMDATDLRFIFLFYIISMLIHSNIINFNTCSYCLMCDGMDYSKFICSVNGFLYLSKLLFDRATQSWYAKKDKYFQVKKLLNEISVNINNNKNNMPRIIIKNIKIFLN